VWLVERNHDEEQRTPLISQGIPRVLGDSTEVPGAKLKTNYILFSIPLYEERNIVTQILVVYFPSHHLQAILCSVT
jgi:hypothetical protein